MSKSDIVLHLLGASPHCSWRASAPQRQWEATLCPGGGHYVCPNFADIAGSSGFIHSAISSQFLEHQFTIRTKELHTQHLALLEGESANEDSVEYGINCDSVLNELTYFHVCSGGLLPDIMHDLEGGLQYEMKLMLQEFILREKYITLDEFNARIECFDLGYMEEKDRPSVPSGHSSHLTLVHSTHTGTAHLSATGQ